MTNTEIETYRGIAVAQLERVFGDEWINLERGREAVIRDYIETANNDGVTATEYRNRIWSGNLQSYADTIS